MQGPLTFQYGYEVGGSPAEVFARCPTTEASFMNLSMAYLAKDCPCVLAPAGSGKSGMLKVGARLRCSAACRTISVHWVLAAAGSAAPQQQG